MTKGLVQLALKHISCHCSSKRHHNISKFTKLSVKCCKKGWSFIKLLVPIAILAIAHRHNTGICKQMSNVLQCFEVVWFLSLLLCFDWWGPSRFSISNFQAYPSLQQVQNCWSMGWPHVLAAELLFLSILSISCWKTSFKCTGIGLQDVCFGVTLWSIWMWYGGTGKHPIPSKTSGKLCEICSLLVTNLGTSCFASGTVTAWLLLWADTFFFDLCTETLLVFLG